MKKALAIDIGGTKIYNSIVDETGALVSDVEKCETPKKLEDIRLLLETIISRGSSYNLGNENSEDSKKNDEASQKAAEMLSIFAEKSEYDFLCAAAVFQKDKELFESALDYMCIILRDALIYSKNKDRVISPYCEIAKKLSFRLTEKQLIECIGSIYKILENFRSSANYNLTVTRLVSELYGIKSK